MFAFHSATPIADHFEARGCTAKMMYFHSLKLDLQVSEKSKITFTFSKVPKKKICFIYAMLMVE